MRKKLPAFTMVELIVAMVLSAIVIGLSYIVYNDSTRSFRESQNNYQKINEMLLLQSLINHDCQVALKVTFEDSTMMVERLDNATVYYQVIPIGIIRDDLLSIDTFKLGRPDCQIRYLFEKAPLIEKMELMFQLSNQIKFPIMAMVFYSNEAKLNYSHTKEGDYQ
jgi:prepilin-type N-terminal cleavage/methylation domain-containing protein